MAYRHHRISPWKRARSTMFHMALWVTGVSLLLILPFRWINPPITSFMITDRLEAVFAKDESYRFRYQWTDWANMSAHIKLAAIAAEDQRFISHFGFDLIEIDKALDARQKGRSNRGASTITQQTAKNLFLWSGQNWIRKGIEAWLTLWLELCWSKERLLEVYLNIAEFGPGVFGVDAASRLYFGHPASHLTSAESALLAAVLPNPVLYQVDTPSEHVRSRQQWILRQMHALGGTRFLNKLKSTS